MAQIETWFDQDLLKPVPVRRIQNVFSQDALGNRIGVRVTSGGEAVTLTGSITGYCILADGTTVPVSGVRSANLAYIDLPQTAYSVPGLITITIKNTDGNTITTLCAVVGLVMRSRTGTQVDPGSTVTDWTNQIAAQLQACQDAADNLGSTLAVPYASLTYPVTAGTYTVRNGNLYRANQNISTSEAWTSGHWTQVTVGNELSDFKSTIDANASIADGFVKYWKNNENLIVEASSSTAAKHVGAKRLGMLTHFAGVSDESLVYVKISGDCARAGNTSGRNSFEKDLSLIEGHKYLLSSKIISGSYTYSGTSSGNISVQIYDSGNTALITNALNMEDTIKTTYYVPDSDVSANLVVHIPRYITLRDLQMYIILQDITASKEMGADVDLYKHFDNYIDPDDFEGTDYEKIKKAMDVVPEYGHGVIIIKRRYTFNNTIKIKHRGGANAKLVFLGIGDDAVFDMGIYRIRGDDTVNILSYGALTFENIKFVGTGTLFIADHLLRVNCNNCVFEWFRRIAYTHRFMQSFYFTSCLFRYIGIYTANTEASPDDGDGIGDDEIIEIDPEESDDSYDNIPVDDEDEQAEADEYLFSKLAMFQCLRDEIKAQTDRKATGGLYDFHINGCVIEFGEGVIDATDINGVYITNNCIEHISGPVILMRRAAKALVVRANYFERLNNGATIKLLETDSQGNRIEVTMEDHNGVGFDFTRRRGYMHTISIAENRFAAEKPGNKIILLPKIFDRNNGGRGNTNAWLTVTDNSLGPAISSDPNVESGAYLIAAPDLDLDESHANNNTDIKDNLYKNVYIARNSEARYYDPHHLLIVTNETTTYVSEELNGQDDLNAFYLTGWYHAEGNNSVVNGPTSNEFYLLNIRRNGGMAQIAITPNGIMSRIGDGNWN